MEHLLKCSSGYNDNYFEQKSKHLSKREKEMNQSNLNIFIKHLRSYDEVRTKLEKEGGGINDLEIITMILKKKVSMQGMYYLKTISLIDQRGLKEFLWEMDDIHLDIRRLDHGLPVYYLCRIYEDYWDDHNFIIEDIYKSPGYLISDERFVTLMSMGKETYYLRLSHLRDQVANGFESIKKPKKKIIDKTLIKLGKNIFQSAWHEDQRLGIITAKHFHIEHFQKAAELLYLCLNSELCELRSKVDDSLLNLFMKVYPQQPIYNLIKKISNMEGSDLDRLPRKALKQYSRLANAFNIFLKTEITWGTQDSTPPLYKVVFGNISRMEIVGKKLKNNQTIIKAKKKMEKVSENIIEDILID